MSIVPCSLQITPFIQTPKPDRSLNRHFRVHNFALPVLSDRPIKRYSLLISYIAGRASNAESEISRLSNKPHAWIIKGEPRWMYAKYYPPRLSRCESNARETEQHALGTSNGSNHISII